MLPDLNIPNQFNAASYFVDRNVHAGRGGNIAIEAGDQGVTYRDLLERVNRVGSALRQQFDVRIEERVVLLLLDSPEFIYSFFGVMKIGAVPVPINTLWKSDDYAYALNDSRARVLIVDASLLPSVLAIPAEALRYLRHIIVVGDAGPAHSTFESLLKSGSDILQAEPMSKDDVAFWLYSSGSTGAPKGCVHLHHDMPFCAHAYAHGVLGISSRDRCFSVAKLFFAYGLGNGMYFPFSVGATTILWPGPPTAVNVYRVIKEHRPTLFFSVPTNFGMLLAHEPDGQEFDLSSVRLAVSAGEALPPSILERFRSRFGVSILDGLGSTEILHIFISNHPHEIRPGSSGRIVDGYQARLVDDEGHVVPTGEIGHLMVKGDSTCSQYWNKHDQTKAMIQGEWISTGDRYHQDRDGYFWHAGRSDDMLKVGGMWVSPTEVENTILEHEAVLECGVVARCDRDTLIKPAAYVVVKSGIVPSPELAVELQEFVRSRLSPYKRPRWVEFVPALPKTATGKIQRFKLRAAAGARAETL